MVEAFFPEVAFRKEVCTLEVAFQEEVCAREVAFGKEVCAEVEALICIHSLRRKEW